MLGRPLCQDTSPYRGAKRDANDMDRAAEMKETVKIDKVEPLDGFWLRLHFSDGAVKDIGRYGRCQSVVTAGGGSDAYRAPVASVSDQGTHPRR